MRQPCCCSTIGICFVGGLLVFALPASAVAAPVTAGLVFWLDATDINADGLPDSFSGGDTLAGWKDKANGYQTKAAGDPNYVVQGIQHADGSWKPVVRFDGEGDWFYAVNDGAADASVLNFTTESLSIFLVARNTNSGYFFSKLQNGGYRLTGHADGLRFQAQEAKATTSDPEVTAIRQFDYAQPSLMTVIYDRVPAQDTVTMYGNGSLLGAVESVPTLTSISALSSVPDNVFTLGANSHRTHLQNLAGDIAELLIYSRVLSDVERTSVEGYLAAKWLVPEPSTLVLAALSLIGLLGWGWKSRTRRKG